MIFLSSGLSSSSSNSSSGIRDSSLDKNPDGLNIGAKKDAFGRPGGSADIELVQINAVQQKQPTAIEYESLFKSPAVDGVDEASASHLQLPIRGSCRYLI